MGDAARTTDGSRNVCGYLLCALCSARHVRWRRHPDAACRAPFAMIPADGRPGLVPGLGLDQRSSPRARKVNA